MSSYVTAVALMRKSNEATTAYLNGTALPIDAARLAQAALWHINRCRDKRAPTKRAAYTLIAVTRAEHVLRCSESSHADKSEAGRIRAEALTTQSAAQLI